MSNNSYVVLKKVNLGQHHKKTGITNHYAGGKLLDTPSKLKIVQYPGEDYFYLIHFSENEEEITDTFHETIEDAMEQAELEFSVANEEWSSLVSS